ncbi:MAG TPA: STAS domain-containing protein [Thermoguttaceae bacterium]|nr:STAS domain-containing protein [Thermoguttaceae bacterium]
MKLAVISDDGDVLRLHASERITESDVAAHPDPMRELLGEEGFARHVVLSLEGVDSIDSSGIGWLVACHKSFRQADGKLVVHSIDSGVMDLLKILKFHQVLHLAKDERAALSAARRK